MKNEIMKTRIVKNILIVAGTMAVIVLAFFLPDITSLAQDNQNANLTEQYETDQVTLDINPTHDLSDTLKLIAEGYAHVSIDEGKIMGIPEVVASAEGFLTYCIDKGFSDLSNIVIEGYEVEPFLAVSDSGEEAVILWECIASNSAHPEASIKLLIDDESGKVVQFSSLIFMDSSEIIDSAAAQSKISLWTDICAEYLGYGYSVRSETSSLPKDEAPSTSKDTGAEGNSEVTSGDLQVWQMISLKGINVNLMLSYDIIEDITITESTPETEDNSATGETDESLPLDDETAIIEENKTIVRWLALSMQPSL